MKFHDTVHDHTHLRHIPSPPPRPAPHLLAALPTSQPEMSVLCRNKNSSTPSCVSLLVKKFSGNVEKYDIQTTAIWLFADIISTFDTRLWLFQQKYFFE